MERGEYGPNGFRWLALGDYQTELANRNIDFELCAPAFVGLQAGFGLSVWIEQLLPDPTLAWSMQLAALGIAALFVWQATIGFHREAQLDGYMPSGRSKSPQPDHITGFGALTALAIVAVVAVVALAGEFNFGKFNIPEWVGFVLVGTLTGLFLVVAVFPRLLDWSAAESVSRLVLQLQLR